MLVGLIEQLGDDEPAQALTNAYAIGHQKPQVLTSRRTDFQAKTGRDPKTIATYENAMIEELATRLLGNQPAELSDSEVYVVAYVKGQHIFRVAVTVRFPLGDQPDIRERTIDYENKSGAHSMPALVYQLPPKWTPRVLTLAVFFTEQPFPARVWGSTTKSLLDLMFGQNGRRLPLDEKYFVNIQVERPRADVLYGIYWTGTARPHASEGVMSPK